MKEIRWKRTREYSTDFGIAYIATKSTHFTTLLHHHHHFLLLLAPSFHLLMTLTPAMRPLRHVSTHRWSTLNLKKLMVSLNADLKQLKKNIVLCPLFFHFFRFSLPSLHLNLNLLILYPTLPFLLFLASLLPLSPFFPHLPSPPPLSLLSPSLSLSRLEIQSFMDRLWVAIQSSSLLYIPGNHTASYSTAHHSTAQQSRSIICAYIHTQPTLCSIILFP